MIQLESTNTSTLQLIEESICPKLLLGLVQFIIGMPDATGDRMA